MVFSLIEQTELESEKYDKKFKSSMGNLEERKRKEANQKKKKRNHNSLQIQPL
jgi:hypothetical protein